MQLRQSVAPALHTTPPLDRLIRKIAGMQVKSFMQDLITEVHRIKRVQEAEEEQGKVEATALQAHVRKFR